MEDRAILLHTIRRGDLFWESDGGRDALFVATTDAAREGTGYGVHGREIPGGKPCHFYVDDRGGGYAPKLYTMPQYTRPDLAAILAGLAAVARDITAEVDAAAKERAATLQTERDEARNSRRQWRKCAERRDLEIDRLRDILATVGDIARQHMNGITMGKQIEQALLAIHPPTAQKDEVRR